MKSSIGPRNSLASQPVATPEHDVQRDGAKHDQGSARPQAAVSRKTWIGEILSVPAGDGRWYGDDRGPRGELLHHHVEATVLERKVCLEHRSNQVA